MEKLGKDQLFLLAIELDLPSLLQFCNTSKRINDLVCKRNEIWLYKLNKEFPNYKNSKISGSYKKIYETLFLNDLKIIVKKLYLRENFDLNELYTLYNLKKIILYGISIKEIPKEIGRLQNLQYLDLRYNQIKEIPKEIGQLQNLEELFLGHNQIEKIPKEIGKLQKLKYLYLEDNLIKEIPKEIGQLQNLEELKLDYFVTVEELPPKIPKNDFLYI